ncbi:hypothetical protein EDB83DRAFT_2350005, partial [Lactarius deliciosus]
RFPVSAHPVSPRSGATSPRPKFDSDQLKPYIKKLLSSTLQNVAWADFKERERGRALVKEIGDRIKERMLEIEPRGFKYIVLTQVNENAGQEPIWLATGKDSDAVVQEMLDDRKFCVDSLICICIAFAVRTV